MCCGATTGPFVDLQVPFVKVPTAIGILDAEGGVYLCVGTPENPGCAVGIGRLTGQLVDITKIKEMHDVNETLNQEIAGLRGALSKKTLHIGDLVTSGLVAWDGRVISGISTSTAA
jgi:hypothetical protein